MSAIEARVFTLPGLRMRALVAGEGPTVVLCHGFPALGRMYRAQLEALAAAGFRAVAPDMRGYGGTDAPLGREAYAIRHVVPDVLHLLDALDCPRAVVVGHDFGALVAWQLAVRHPARLAGVGALAVPYEPRRAPVRPTEAFAALAQKHFFHVHYFQAEGVAERELDPRPRTFLRTIYHALSGHADYTQVWSHPSDAGGYLDVLPAPPDGPLPFLPDDELDALAAEFARTGFRGGLSWYRAFDANWADLEAVDGAKVEVPALYVGGSRDVVVRMAGERGLARMRAHVPDLRVDAMLEGAGHFLPWERPREVSDLLLTFLRGLDAAYLEGR